MSDAIYLIQNEGELVAMTDEPYDSEAVLQELLAKYPDVLAGDQMSTEQRRWLLVTREMSVPDRENGGTRWSADHLFIDQDAIPTIVEVKRSTDTRIRREVVGQMLDYAANAVVYWPYERLRSQFETTCTARGADPAITFADAFGADIDQDDFWGRVGTNLRAGKVRLVFVADQIPPELKRIVEFLNGQMNPAEVLAVEVRQYAGKGLRALVPRLIGATVEAQRAKGDQPLEKRKWDEAGFMADVATRRGTNDAALAQRILNWARERNLDIWWGEGNQFGSFFPMLRHGGDSYWLVAVWTYGRVEVQFKYMATRRPFDDKDMRLTLARRLNQIPGVDISEDAIEKRPAFALSALTQPDSMDQFLQTLNWVIEEYKRAST